MNLLQLDGYDFAGVTETDHDYHLRAEVTAHRDFCPKCFKRDLVGFGRRGLVNDRWLLLKRRHELTERDQMMLSGWLNNYPDLAKAYEVKESVFDIYTSATASDAQERYAEWRSSVPQEMRGAFGDFQRAWDNWEPEITAYFDHRITNAYTESLNNLIRITNRIGRGYSFEALRAKMLLSESARKTRRPKFQRIAHAEQGLPDPSMFPRHLGVSLSTLAQDFCAEGEEAEKTVNYG